MSKNLIMVQYVLTYAKYTLEDSLLDFQEDVMMNQGWTQEQAEAGYTMLQNLIASLDCHIAIVADEGERESNGTRTP